MEAWSWAVRALMPDRGMAGCSPLKASFRNGSKLTRWVRPGDCERKDHNRLALPDAAAGVAWHLHDVMILIGASIFGYFFTLTDVTQDLVAWVGALPTSRWVIIVLILCGYIVLGSFMD